jgi:hypothetical protein
MLHANTIAVRREIRHRIRRSWERTNLEEWKGKECNHPELDEEYYLRASLAIRCARNAERRSLLTRLRRSKRRRDRSDIGREKAQR